MHAVLTRARAQEEFRVLTAVEMGMKNHELVPTQLICQIAGLKKGGARKLIGNLHRNKLLYHESKKYDGYRLTYTGYDYLALRVFVARGHIKAFGKQIGVGKEADVFTVLTDDDRVAILKIHRLGRVSFRNVKNKRDYLLHRKSASWLYMSRLAALREYAYMRALYKNKFATPEPIDCNRHCILMSRVDGRPFSHLRELPDPGLTYTTLMNMIVRLAEKGLIHCDFNEFNLMISDEGKVTMIDFPQMVSTSHRDAKMYFERDVNCVRVYFAKKFKFNAEKWPRFFRDVQKDSNLDSELEASGYKNTHYAQDDYMAYRSAVLTDADGLYENANGDGDEEAAEVQGRPDESLPVLRVAPSKSGGDEKARPRDASAAAKMTPLQLSESAATGEDDLDLPGALDVRVATEEADAKATATAEENQAAEGGARSRVDATGEAGAAGSDRRTADGKDDDGHAAEGTETTGAVVAADGDTKAAEEDVGEVGEGEAPSGEGKKPSGQGPRKKKKSRRRYENDRARVRARIKKASKKGGGRSRNVQKNRKRQELARQIKAFT